MFSSTSLPRIACEQSSTASNPKTVWSPSPLIKSRAAYPNLNNTPGDMNPPDHVRLAFSHNIWSPSPFHPSPSFAPASLSGCFPISTTPPSLSIHPLHLRAPARLLNLLSSERSKSPQPHIPLRRYEPSRERDVANHTGIRFSMHTSLAIKHIYSVSNRSANTADPKTVIRTSNQYDRLRNRNALSGVRNRICSKWLDEFDLQCLASFSEACYVGIIKNTKHMRMQITFLM